MYNNPYRKLPDTKQNKDIEVFLKNYKSFNVTVHDGVASFDVLTGKLKEEKAEFERIIKENNLDLSVYPVKSFRRHSIIFIESKK